MENTKKILEEEAYKERKRDVICDGDKFFSL